MKTRERIDKIYEGKTKTIWSTTDSDKIIVECKDELASHDGTRRDFLKEKGALSTLTACNCFYLLETAGMETHFIDQIAENAFLAWLVNMIPIKFTARRVASGSYIKRHPYMHEGIVFEPALVEYFLKDKEQGDPLIVFHRGRGCFEMYHAHVTFDRGYIGELEKGQIVTPLGFIEQTRAIFDQITRDVFDIIEEAWAKQDFTLIDLTIELGFTLDNRLVVADVIDHESWHIWPGGEKKLVENYPSYSDLQQSTPESLERVRDSYTRVARATSKFFIQARA